jgi:disulfide bond formation protein DsbB
MSLCFLGIFFVSVGLRNFSVRYLVLLLVLGCLAGGYPAGAKTQAQKSPIAPMIANAGNLQPSATHPATKAPAQNVERGVGRLESSGEAGSR